MRLVDADVVLLLHALDQLFDQFIELLHLHLLQPLAHLLVEQVAIEQSLLDGAAKIFESLLAGEIVKHVVLESALQKVVRERAEQVFHAHFTGGIGYVFAVLDALQLLISGGLFLPRIHDVFRIL